MPDVLIPGATLSTFVPRPEDVGRQLYCRVKATNVAGFAFASAVPTGAIAASSGAPVAPSNLSLPNIADITPNIPETLHVTDGTWLGSPAPTLSYQWHRVTGAVGVPPSNTGLPNIADTTPVQGETLHVTDGTWSGDAPITYGYQWKRGSTSVGTSSADYLLIPADVGANMSCVVTATNAAGAVPATSNTVGPVTATGTPPASTGAPSIADTTPEVGETLHTTDGTWSGAPAPTFGYQWHRVTVVPSGGTPSIADTTPVEGETLHCDRGTWAGTAPITYAYQWKRGATNVGTDLADYLLVPGDVTFNMSCVVTASNVAGSSSPATSNVVGPVAAASVAPSNTVAPVLTGSAVEGSLLTVTDGTWTGNARPDFQSAVEARRH